MTPRERQEIERQEIERKIITFMLQKLRAHGWTPANVWDGGEQVNTTTDEDVLDAVRSVDESTIKFRKEVSGRLRLRIVDIVLGNSGHDCIADYSGSVPGLDGDDFEAVMGEVQEYANTFEPDPFKES